MKCDERFAGMDQEIDGQVPRRNLAGWPPSAAIAPWRLGCGARC
jgi:hypothetical protein